MKLTITSIELKNPLKFFVLSFHALQILKQLQSDKQIGFKKRGFWTKHYTMSLWKNEADIKSFASSGAHLEAMKQSKKIAKEIRTLTIDAESFPEWKEAYKLLEKAKVLRF